MMTIYIIISQWIEPREAEKRGSQISRGNLTREVVRGHRGRGSIDWRGLKEDDQSMLMDEEAEQIRRMGHRIHAEPHQPYD
ncbi:hypothetical protein ZHAS_00009748 [Anopheles sinensis]|uniref:Uncharacterized protein n=1 Tax=Anopheles sinensis TaxID=74873 RepID=A0A084VVU5_ANOSI|nr:hypothetical protein ZHAS_00009748 [Anopheles sinensis]